jgi:hypothetical protein
MHIPLKMAMDVHFTEFDARARTLRIEFGIRYFSESSLSEYGQVELRIGAVAHHG